VGWPGCVVVREIPCSMSSMMCEGVHADWRLTLYFTNDVSLWSIAGFVGQQKKWDSVSASFRHIGQVSVSL